MKRLAIVFVVLMLFAVRTAAAEETAQAVVQRAVKAHGGKKGVARLRAMRVKAKGTIKLIPGSPAVPFQLEDVWQMPDRYKSTTTMTINGRKFVQTLVLDGKKGWMTINGATRALPEKAAEEMREQKYAEDCDRFAFLDDKDVKLSLLKETTVNGQAALGVRIQKKGRRDVRLYFSKKNGLLVKRAHEVLDPMTGKNVKQDVHFRDYKTTNGLPHYRTIVAFHNGKLHIKAEITEVKPLEKVGDKEFQKPNSQ